MLGVSSKCLVGSYGASTPHKDILELQQECANNAVAGNVRCSYEKGWPAPSPKRHGYVECQ